MRHLVLFVAAIAAFSGTSLADGTTTKPNRPTLTGSRIEIKTYTGELAQETVGGGKSRRPGYVLYTRYGRKVVRRYRGGHFGLDPVFDKMVGRRVRMKGYDLETLLDVFEWKRLD